jgi:hypothetical protein
MNVAPLKVRCRLLDFTTNPDSCYLSSLYNQLRLQIMLVGVGHACPNKVALFNIWRGYRLPAWTYLPVNFRRISAAAATTPSRLTTSTRYLQLATNLAF